MEDDRNALGYGTRSTPNFFFLSVCQLTSIYINILNRDRIMLDPIKFHCGDVVVVNGKGEEGTACDLDEAQAVSFALFDCYDGSRGPRAVAKGQREVGTHGREDVLRH